MTGTNGVQPSPRRLGKVVAQPDSSAADPAMKVAAEVCVFTNDQVTIETV